MLHLHTQTNNIGFGSFGNQQECHWWLQRFAHAHTYLCMFFLFLSDWLRTSSGRWCTKHQQRDCFVCSLTPTMTLRCIFCIFFTHIFEEKVLRIYLHANISHELFLLLLCYMEKYKVEICSCSQQIIATQSLVDCCVALSIEASFNSNTGCVSTYWQTRCFLGIRNNTLRSVSNAF